MLGRSLEGLAHAPGSFCLESGSLGIQRLVKTLQNFFSKAGGSGS